MPFDDPTVIQLSALVFGLTAEARRRYPKIDGWPVLIVVLVFSFLACTVSEVTMMREPGAFFRTVGAVSLYSVAIFAGLRQATGMFAPSQLLEALREEPRIVVDDRPTPTEPTEPPR